MWLYFDELQYMKSLLIKIALKYLLYRKPFIYI